MVPDSLNFAYSDGESQVLWEDGDRVFRRGWRLGDDGKRRVVLLVAPAADHPSRSNLDRLTHEFELKDELDRSWAVRPLDLVRDVGRTMLVLEDEGSEPVDRLVGAPMETGRFLHLAIASSLALSKLHQRGLVHKDIKPANVMVNGATGEVRLTGFGIASRLARERHSPDPPETIAGTLAYMAPEQTGRMNRSIDSRSDLYALGITFYQMLTGTLPFTAADSMEWVHCHLAKRPVPPAERLKEIPSAISAIVVKLLAKTAEDRYQTAAGLESDLRRCQTEWQAEQRIDDFPLGEHDIPDRLLLPEKLYGRQCEVGTLLAAFDRIVNGAAPELVLVSGYSGIGKSSVVNELQPVLVPPRGLFASGKFDQYKRDIPYSTLAQASQGLIRPLLGKSDAQLAPWRDALREALGPNAGLIADLVPDVKFIVGEPPPVPEVPPQDAQRRFQLVFRQFIGVFARPEHPLALFLDDLQWLDAATLDLLEDLLSRSDLRGLLLIGAYRDNEVTAAHPLMRKLEAIRAAGKIQDIKLAPLAADDLNDLIADALHCDAEQASQLAALVHEKTGGNPFFVIQFLRTLADEGLLAFHHEHAHWYWDIGGIRAKGHTDNVVEFLAGRLTRLPLETQGALRQLACLGRVADVATLANVLGRSEETVQAALWEAVNQQLVERGERAYKFVHDHVHEAAYALIPEKSRAEAHLTIGRLLVKHTPPEKRDQAIFEIVNQLNRAVPLITSQEERQQLAELNLAAGMRAEASSAHVSALTYFATGAALLPADAWARRQELAFELELHTAGCEAGTGALRAAEERLAALAARAIGTIQQCFVARRRLGLYTMLGQGERAITVALECLRHVGIDWPAHPSEAVARGEYERIWSLLGDRAIESLVDMPLMRDPGARATMDLLADLMIPALYTDGNLATLSVCRAASLSIQLGNSDTAPGNYQSLALIASARYGDHEKGYRFGKMACDLLERRRWIHLGAGTYFGFASIVPWTRPVIEGIDPARRAIQVAKEYADPTVSALASRTLTSILLASGHPLDQIEIEADDALEFLRPFGFFLDRISAPLALVRMLRGKTEKFGSLDDGRFAERDFEERVTSQPAQAFLECYYWLRKLQARFFAGDYVSAIDAADRVATWYATSPSLSLFMLEKEEYHFYAALARAARCEPIGPDPYANHREALGRHERELRTWATSCPQNFEDRAALVGAEIARIEGRPLEAMDLYERAIASARARGFVHNEALAYELAARFYAARGFEEFAQVYLGSARQGYLRWGADGKVRQLDQHHPRLRRDERAPGPMGTIEVPVEQLDVATVIQIAQALSGEVVLEKLIDRLMRAAIKHAGADRGLLICPRSDELLIYAEANAQGEDIAIQVGERDASGAGTLPESLVRYILRTGETVVLDDASSQNSFSADPYIVQGRARSILCVPMINQGRFAGILYFENNLAPHVFTPDRLTVLKVLATQGAISLENVGLYRALANREAKIQRLFDANVLGIYIWNLEGTIIEANEAFLQMLQYGREDVVSGRLLWTDLTPGELREQDERAVVELRSTGTFQPFEKEFLRKDGGRVPVLIGGALFEESRNQGVAFVLDLTVRKRAEKALKHSETRYQNLFQAMAVSFFELDYTSSRPILRALRDAGVHDFRNHFKKNPHLIREIMRTTYVVDVNDQTVALFGGGNKEELLTSVGAFWPEESLNDYVEAVLATIAGNDKFSTETRVRRLDGTIFDALFTLRYVSEDKTRGLAGVIDITERKRAENALRENEERFRDYAETASDWLWEMGPDHKLTMLTPNAFGSSPSARLGTAAWERALDLDTEPEKWRAIRATMDSHQPFRDFIYLAAGGEDSPMYVRASGKPVFGADGEFLGYRGTGTDATAIIRAQEALRESERNLRSAIDGIPGLVAVLAPNGDLEAVNRQIFQYTGQSLEELRNWGTNGMIHPDDLPQLAEIFTKSIAAGIPYRTEARVRRFDGEYRWFEIRGIPVREGSSDRIVRWYSLLTDTDDRTQALARLQQMRSDFAHMNRVSMMGELAASLSHEIAQPIASARNNARAAQNFLERQPQDLGEVREALSCVVGDTDRAGEIIDRIRDQIKKAPPRKERFDLNAAIDEVIVLAQSVTLRNGISVQTRLAEGLLSVPGDRIQLQQVLLNLILNAAEAMSSVEEGARELVISTEHRQAGALVAVRDSGPGIAQAHLDRVFDAFYTTKSSGTGMGLSICRSIIDAHGGKLWAEANGPRGAAFQFTLPDAERELTASPRAGRPT